MQHRRVFMSAALLTIVGLLAASCAPAAAPTAPAASKTDAPAGKPGTPPAAPTQAPSAGPAAPSPTAKPAGDQPRYGGVLKTFDTFDIPNFDIHQASSASTQQPTQHTYNGLLQFDPVGDPSKIVGDLAEKWAVSQDGLTYTFNLLKGVTWHDGKPFTAEDARFSMERMANPPEGTVSPRKAWFIGVNKIAATNENTLTVTLAYPRAALVPCIASAWTKIMPKHVIDAKKDMKRDVLGTGPFKYKNYIAGTSLELVKNESYFVKGRPYLDGVVRYIIKDPATSFAALRTHRVDITPITTGGLLKTQAEVVNAVQSATIAAMPFSHMGFAYYVMNTQVAPFDDIRVRQAVNLLIDRQSAGKVVPEGTAVGAFTLPGGQWAIPPDELAKTPGYRQPKDADIAEAKKLLADAGYANGLKTRAITRMSSYMVARGEFVKNELAKVGIDVQLDIKEDAALYSDLYSRRYPSMAYGEGIALDDPDEYLLTYYHSKGSKNYSLINDKTLDDLLDNQSRTLDVKQRLELSLKAQRRIIELAPAVMLYFIQGNLAFWKEVRNFAPGNGIYERGMHQDTWLAK